jgi:transposase
MFFPEGQVRVFLYGQPVNMRLSFDGLYALAKHVMHQDPLSVSGERCVLHSA